jgi:hypothetical protein
VSPANTLSIEEEKMYLQLNLIETIFWQINHERGVNWK